MRWGKFTVPVLASILILGAFTVGYSFDDAFAKGNGQPKVTICHVDQETGEEKTISISNKAVDKHKEKHGDTDGACVDEPEPPKLDSFTLQYSGITSPVDVTIYDETSLDINAKQMSTFVQTVNDGESFTYVKADMDKNEGTWNDDSYFRLLEAGTDNILAEIKIHVSCSQPLKDGDTHTDGDYSLIVVGDYCDPD